MPFGEATQGLPIWYRHTSPVEQGYSLLAISFTTLQSAKVVGLVQANGIIPSHFLQSLQDAKASLEVHFSGNPVQNVLFGHVYTVPVGIAFAEQFWY